MKIAKTVKFNEKGLVPVIAQDSIDQTVLMLAWANAEAIELTAQTGYAHYFSRSRQKIWKKGEESGNLQKIKSIRLDCDADAVLYEVEQIGGVACHTGHKSCFYRAWNGTDWEEFSSVLKDPDLMYGKGKS